MNKKIFSNFIYQSSYQLLLILLPIITIPIVSRALAPAGVGIFNYVSSIVNYFVLFAGLGLANYAVREIAYVKTDQKKLSQKFWEIQFFNVIFSSIVLIIYIVVAYFVEYKELFLIQSFMIIAVILDISWFFQGIEKFGNIAFSNFLIKLFSFILTILFVRDKSDIIIYFWINSLNGVLTNLIFWIFIKNKVIWVKVTFKQIMSHFVPALSFFILKISSTIFNNVNKTLLGLMSSVASVGIFSNALTMVTMIGTVVNSMNLVMLPRMSSLEKENNEEKFIDILEKSIHMQLFFTIALMFGVLATNTKLIGWFFGNEFTKIKYIVPILAPIIVFQSLHQGIANQYLVPKNRLLSYNITMVFGTIINIIIGSIYIPRIGIYGASYAFSIGQLFLGVSRSFVLVKNSHFKFDMRRIFSYIISGLFMWLIIFLVTRNLPSNLFITLMQVVLGVSIYMILTAIFKVNPIWDLLVRKGKKDGKNTN